MTDKLEPSSYRSKASGLSADQPINFTKMDNISLRSETSNWSMDQPTHFKEMDPLDNISKNVDKSESPSCRSEESNISMDPPTNFKKMEPLDHKSKQMHRSESPSCRSEASNLSMDQPANFMKTKPLDNKSKKEERPESPSCRSEISSCSKDQPTNFKNMKPLYYKRSKKGNRTEPPSNMKRTKSLEFTSKKGRRPESPSRRSTRSASSVYSQTSWRAPSANISYVSMATTTTSEETQEPRQNPRAAGPRDVACDLCTEKKQKAYKSCMTCLASFCEIHIKDHYTIEAMKRHTLVEVTKNLVILQENAQLKETITKVRTKNLDLMNEIAMLNQKITELKLPDFICKGKTPKAANVVLDPDTAHCVLQISNNGKHVQFGNKTNVHHNTQRFDKSECVLAREGFNSGRHYWEVEVNRDFTIGVTCQSSQRKGKVTFCPKEGYWCLYHYRQSLTALEDSSNRLQADTLPRVLGVCIDVDEKWVTFYNSETKAPIYTFKDMVFSDGEKLYPVFNIMEKSVSLVIRTVRDD